MAMGLNPLMLSVSMRADPFPCSTGPPALHTPLSPFLHPSCALGYLASSHLASSGLAVAHESSPHRSRRHHLSKGSPRGGGRQGRNGGPLEHDDARAPSWPPRFSSASAQPERRDGARIGNAAWRRGGRPSSRSSEQQIMEGYRGTQSHGSLGEPPNANTQSGSRVGFHKVPWRQEGRPSSGNLEHSMEGYRGTQSKRLLRASDNADELSGSLRSSRTAALSKPQDGASRLLRKAPWHQGGRPSSRSLEQVTEEEEGLDEGVESRHFAGGEGRTTMQRIIEKLRKVSKGSAEPKVVKTPKSSEYAFRRTPGSIFLPKRGQDLFSISKGWTTPDHPIPEPGKGILDARFPWERDQDSDPNDKAQKVARVKPPSMAELTVPQPELRRLRMLALRLMHRIKIGRLGVTDAIVEMIHQKWRDSEVVKVKCEGPPALNMKKTHEDLERKTGGLVIWRAGSVAVVYRGKDYKLERTEQQDHTIEAKLENAIWSEKTKDESPGSDQGKLDEPAKPNDIDCQGANEGVNPESGIVKPFNDLDEEYELEVENILAELGPPYEDWPGRKPIPVDADLLPVYIPGYKPPFRLLPYGVRSKLSNSEVTNLRRLARPLPPHFALGRNKGQYGLAVAIVKLWEKSEVAKIFVKRGVQNTNNERMAEELKHLTGGVLLSRDKFFITLYRGKDFLPRAVAAALAEREALTKALQEEEERTRAETSIPILTDNELKSSAAGTLAGTLEARTTWEKWMGSEEQKKLQLQAAKARRFEQARKMERKVNVALKKKEKAQKELEKVEIFLQPSDPPVDQETITEEERFMFRKLGLKMNAFLLIGRRGVFDGIVENMHLHWKHRELIKIIFKEKDPAVVEETARMLEYESGGVLVAVVATSKGQAIIVYRGKNYQRPSQLRPKNLLTKRKALKRSMEIQRRESLNRHILALEKEIDKMKEGLRRMEELNQAEAARSLIENHDDADKDESQRRIEELDQAETARSVNENHDDADKDESQGDSEQLLHGGEEISQRNLSDDGRPGTMRNLSEPKSIKISKLNRFFKAEPPTNREKLKLRKQALSMGKPAHFHVGKGNVLGGLARAIRSYFQKHALVKIGVKGRARGTSVQELVHALEEATGGVLVSLEYSKIILYRGWPDGEDRPSSDFDEEDLPLDLLAAMEEEDEDAYYDVSDDEAEDHDVTSIYGMVSDDEGFQDDNDLNDAGALLSEPEDYEESDDTDDFIDGDTYKCQEEVTDAAAEASVTDIEALIPEPEEDEKNDKDVDVGSNCEAYEYLEGAMEEALEVYEVDNSASEY